MPSQARCVIWFVTNQPGIMFRRLLPFLIFPLLTACVADYDGSSTSTAYLVNVTNHKIVLQPYSSGQVRLEDTVILEPGRKVLMNHFTEFGKTTISGGFFSVAMKADSVVVIFDDQHRISHYLPSATQIAPKHYLFNEPHNFLNQESFEGLKLSETKYSATYQFTYSFTEEDYLKAR